MKIDASKYLSKYVNYEEEGDKTFLTIVLILPKAILGSVISLPSEDPSWKGSEPGY